MNNKSLLLLGSATLIVFLLLLTLVFIRLTAPKPEQLLPTPTPTTADSTPTPLPTILPNELRVISALPQNQNQTYLPIQKVTLVFNDTITPDDLTIETNPATPTTILQGDSNTLYVVPQTAWTTGTTTITVLQTTRSSNGKALLIPYTYSIITELPEGPPLDEYYP